MVGVGAPVGEVCRVLTVVAENGPVREEVAAA